MDGFEEKVIAHAFASYSILFFGILLISYIIFTRKRSIPESLNAYFFEGKFNVENIIDQIIRIENAFGLNYNRVKKQIIRYNYVSRGKLMKYGDKINRQLFCLMMDGRPRYAVFKQFCDPFLKTIIISHFISNLFFAVLFSIYFGIFAFFITLFLFSIITLFYFKLLSQFLEFIKLIARSSNKKVAGTSISLLALNALLKSDVKRVYNKRAQRYHYYENVKYSAHYDNDDSDDWGSL